MEKNFYTVVVLGEFKRGKSTFVNALLGTSLLPTNILPETATINVIIFSEKPKVSVITKDGEVKGKPTPEFLKKFSAQSADEEYLNQIRYIKIGYPLEILKNRIVLVDTPGVSDLSAQRSEITHKFIPKSNTVIFVLDANSPLKKTEKDFIENHLIPLGITDILFLLNKYDQVDEEEDADLLDDVRKKLINSFNVGAENSPFKKIECLPVSSIDALNGIMKGNQELIKLSGIIEVRKKLSEMLSTSQIENKKQVGYQNRLRLILNYLSDHLNNMRAVKLADSDELKRAVSEIEKLLAERSHNEIKIDDYTEATKKKIFAITDKSIKYFHQRLEEEICESIENYNNENFQEFVENTIARSIKKNFDTWVRMYSPSIETLLIMFEKELSRGLSYHFKQKINISTQKSEFNFGEFLINFNVEDVSDADLKVKTMAAVGTLGLMSIMGAGIVPLMGFFAVPYFRKKYLTERLEQAKSSVIPEVKNSMLELTLKMQDKIHTYVNECCNVIVENAKFAYGKILSDMREVMTREIEEKKSAESDARQIAANIQKDINEINSLKIKLK